jgi:hypothetical protein
MSPRNSCRRLFWTLICTVSASGCTPEIHRYMRFPSLENPGSAPYQRAEAIQHDPYPLDDVGPPIVGGRPLGYLQSVNEVERARMAAPRMGLTQPIPVPALPAAPPPVVSTPPVITTSPPVVTTPPVVTMPQAPPPIVPSAPNPIQPRSPY